MDHYCEKDMNINTPVLTCFIQAPPIHHSLVFFRTIFCKTSTSTSILRSQFSDPYFLSLYGLPFPYCIVLHSHIFLHNHKLMSWQHFLRVTLYTHRSPSSSPGPCFVTCAIIVLVLVQGDLAPCVCSSRGRFQNDEAIRLSIILILGHFTRKLFLYQHYIKPQHSIERGRVGGQLTSI